MFYSPNALADSCSGAAKCAQTLLDEITRAGHQCLAVTGPVVDGPSHLFAQAMAFESLQTLEANGVPLPLRRITVGGFDHIIAGSAGRPAKGLLAIEDAALFQLFLRQFEEMKPDVLLSFGGFTSVQAAGRHAMARGCRSVLFATTDSYTRAEDVAHVDLIAAISQALRARLDRVTSLPKVVLSSMVETSTVIAPTRAPEFITLINPAPAKGLKLAAALARECQKLGRPYRFLFVESRGTRATALQHCPELKDCANVAWQANVTNMRGIYARTKILLYPSVWYETAGRTPIEANANGIPVLASNVGGIPEVLNGAGYVFDPPAAMCTDWLAPPPPDYLTQWLDVLDRLHTDPAAMADAERRARAAHQRYDVAEIAGRLLKAL